MTSTSSPNWVWSQSSRSNRPVGASVSRRRRRRWSHCDDGKSVRQVRWTYGHRLIHGVTHGFRIRRRSSIAHPSRVSGARVKSRSMSPWTSLIRRRGWRCRVCVHDHAWRARCSARSYNRFMRSSADRWLGRGRAAGSPHGRGVRTPVQAWAIATPRAAGPTERQLDRGGRLQPGGAGPHSQVCRPRSALPRRRRRSAPVQRPRWQHVAASCRRRSPIGRGRARSVPGSASPAPMPGEERRRPAVLPTSPLESPCARSQPTRRALAGRWHFG